MNDIATQRLIQARDLRNMYRIVASAPPDRRPKGTVLDAVVDTGAPGAVEDGGRTIRRVSGAGNLRTGQPPRPVQTFRVASQTKAFVATIVLQLVAESRVGLDAR